jgi:NHL repeat
VLTPRDNRQQLPLYADNGGALAAGTSLDVRPWRVRVLILGAASLVRARSRFRALRGIVALFAALLVSLTLTAAASADVSFTKAYGWGVLDGASQFETCTSTCEYGIAGGGAGQLEDSYGVATDSSGDVYVADFFNNRVDEFSAAGAFIKAYGWGVADGASQFETCTSSCQAGISGGGAGQLDSPEGIATNSSGDIYVVDSGNERIDEFSAAGAFIKAYGWGVADGLYQFETCTSTCQSGRAGSGAGQFEEPGGIATDSLGDVYVGDDYNERIDEFSAAGAFIKAFGSPGYGAGQLEDPEGVATDSSGDVYVADFYNNRIDEFSAAGAFIKAYGWGVADGMEKFETCTSTCQQGIGDGGAGGLDLPTGVATDSSGDVYVAEGDRVDEFSAAGAFIEAYGWGVADGASQFETCTSTCQGGGFGGGAGELDVAWGVAVDGSGDVYVADGAQERIDEFSAAGAPSTTSTSLSSIGSPADGQTFSLNQSPLKPKATPKAISATAAFSLPSAKQCVSKRKFTIHVRKLPGITWVSAVIKINHKRVKTVGRSHITALVNLVSLPKGTFVLSITAKASNGQSVTGTRTYHTCVQKSKSHYPTPKL